MFTINKSNGTERRIGAGEPCFIIAEVSANHDGSYEKAVEIVRAAAAAGADAVKIQTYTPDTMTIDSDKPWFIVGEQIGSKDNPETWRGLSLYQLYQKAYTPYEWHEPLKRLAEELGIIFFSTPYEETAVDFLETLNVPLYKVASYETTHIPFLRRLGRTGKPVIMSVGFSTPEEIMLSVNTLRDNGTKDIILLHCTTSYSKTPKDENANLNTMLDLKTRFGVDIGFSDNNAGTGVAIQAVMMGACVVEKHVIAADGDKVIDGDFSLGPKEFRALVDGIRKAERTRGQVVYGPKSETERGNARYQRSIFVVKDMKAGEIFDKENIRVIRPRLGLEPKEYDAVLGTKAAREVLRGTPLTNDMIVKNEMISDNCARTSDDQKTKIKAHWDEQAAKGADNPLATTNDKLLRELEIKSILSHIPDAPLRIADVGCGTGYSTMEFARQRPARFVGIDYSENMIGEADKLLAGVDDAVRGRVEFHVGDVLSLQSLNLELFDIVTTDRCLINLTSAEDQKQAIAQIHGIIKPGGAYIMCEGSRQGFAKVNELCALSGLPLLTNYWHNIYLDEDILLPYVAGLFDVVAIENFASTYYVASRIYNAVSAPDQAKPDYFSPINRTAVNLPPIGDYSPLRTYYLRKR